MVKIGFLRKWNGVLLAFLLALAVLTPTVDSFVCIDDAGGKAVMAQADGAAGNLPVQQHDDGDSSCIHGHCHHWVGYPRLNERLAFAAIAGRAGPISSGHGHPVSAPPLELLRPPQA